MIERERRAVEDGIMEKIAINEKENSCRMNILELDRSVTERHYVNADDVLQISSAQRIADVTMIQEQ